MAFCAYAKCYCLLLDSIELFIAEPVLMSPFRSSFLFPVFFRTLSLLLHEVFVSFQTATEKAQSQASHLHPCYHANMTQALGEVQWFPVISSGVKSG